MRTAKTLIRLGECPGWSESSLGAQSFCWFCHVAAHFTKTVPNPRLLCSWIVGYKFFSLFMPPTLKTLKGNIGLRLSMRVSVRLCKRSRTVRDRILKFDMWNVMKNKRTRIFFFFVGLVTAELCPPFDSCVVKLWNLVNKISVEPLELGSWYLANRLCPRHRWSV